MTRLLACLILLALPVLSLAQDVPPAEIDVMAVVKALVAAVQGGQWPLVVVLVFVALVYVLRKVGAKWIPWLGTSDGGTILTFLTVMASVVGAGALVPGTVITWAFLLKGATLALAAIGGWTGTRRFLGVLAPLVAKIPGVGPALAGLLTWLSGVAVAKQVEVKASGEYVPVPAGVTPQQAADLLAKPPAP